MTYPRSHLVSAEESGCYHAVSRYVRRASLCSMGKLTGECFVQALLGNPDRLEVLRGRLGSLSWFMKALNEPIARMAKREDVMSATM